MPPPSFADVFYPPRRPFQEQRLIPRTSLATFNRYEPPVRLQFLRLEPPFLVLMSRNLVNVSKRFFVLFGASLTPLIHSYSVATTFLEGAVVA